MHCDEQNKEASVWVYKHAGKQCHHNQVQKLGACTVILWLVNKKPDLFLYANPNFVFYFRYGCFMWFLNKSLASIQSPKYL